MVHRTYVGLGRGDEALEPFQALTPYARQLLELQAECHFESAGYAAFGVAVDGLQTAAFHFTRRARFYDALVGPARAAAHPGNNRLADREEALHVFEELTPYFKALRALQARCRPFGHDYLALEIARHGLITACLHFTGRSDLYAAAAAGPFRG